MKKVAILLAAHGQFAKAALDSAEMIIGKQSNVGIFTLEKNDSLEVALKKVEEVFMQSNREKGTLVLTDIYGGTPSNVVGSLLQKNENIQIFTGLNLHLLIQVLLAQEETLDELSEMVVRIYGEALVNVNKQLKEAEVDGDCLD